jgi:uncharacterized protein YlaI
MSKGRDSKGRFKKGYRPSPETEFKKGDKRIAGEANTNWKGDDVGYHGVHSWIRRHKPMPSKCEICNDAVPMDAANISGKYLRDFDDWEWLCRKCHFATDLRRSIKLSNSLKGNTNAKKQS